jgi:hypothetical protein
VTRGGKCNTHKGHEKYIENFILEILNAEMALKASLFGGGYFLE